MSEQSERNRTVATLCRPCITEDQRADPDMVHKAMWRVPDNVRVKGLRPIDAGRREQAQIVASTAALRSGASARYKTRVGIRLNALRENLWSVG